MKRGGFDGSVRQRLAAACGLSLMLHVVVIGGWTLLGSGPRAPRPKEGPTGREISVKVIDHGSTPKTPIGGPNAAEDRGELPSGTAPGTASAGAAVPAQRLLDDPATGLIFSAYFKAVKSRLVRRASKESVSVPAGELRVHFVLSRDGRVEGVWTPEGTPPEGERFAARLLAAAGPFPPFPSTIRHPSIAFDVLFRFDENVLG